MAPHPCALWLPGAAHRGPGCALCWAAVRAGFALASQPLPPPPRRERPTVVGTRRIEYGTRGRGITDDRVG